MSDIYNDESFCENSSILPHQEKASDKILESKRGILLFHAIGSGKTLTTLLAISKIMKNDKSINKVYYIMSDILIKNFEFEREKHGFPEYKSVHIKDSSVIPESGIVVMDEAHLFTFSLINLKDPETIAIYKNLEKSQNCKIIMLSGTPIYDTPFDLSPMINLLAGQEILPRSGSEFKNTYFNEFLFAPFRIGLLRKIFREYVSYFAMEDSVLFPKIKSIDMLYFDVPYEARSSIKDPEDEFFAGPGLLDAVYQNIQTHKNEIGNVFIYCSYPDRIHQVEKFMKSRNLEPYIKISKDNLHEVHKYKYILGSSESTVGISIPDCRFAYLITIPDYFGDIQQVSGRVRRICIHKSIPKNKRDIKYWVLVPSHGDSLIKKKLKNIGLFSKMNEQFIEIMKDSGV